MADLTKTISVIFQGEDKLSGSVSDIERKFTSVGNEAAAAGSKVDALGHDIEGVGKKSTAIETATTALKAFAASLVLKAFIDSNVELERFEKGMVAVSGSSAAAKAELEFLRGVTSTLGIEFGAAANGFLSLSAATKGTALEGEATRTVFEAVAKAMSALGRSSDETNGALLAISQIVSKGTVSMEELRGQLGERLPGAFQVAARSMGLTTEELGKLVESGQLAAADFLPKFAAELNKTFSGATFDGYTNALSRLKNNISETFTVVGAETGGFSALTKLVEFGATGVAAYAGGLDIIADKVRAYYALLQTGNQEAFNREMTDIAVRAERAGLAISGELNQSLAETQRLLRQGTPDTLTTGFSDARFEADRLKEGAKEVDAALKTLGLDPKKFEADVQKITDAFKVLTSDPAVSGDTILAGLKKTLEQLKNEDQVNAIIENLSQAFEAGQLSSNQYVKAIDLARKRIIDLGDAFPPTTDAAKQQAEQLKKNEEAARRAQEAAEKYKLELEKLASNERIKLIEAKVQLDVANVEANARIAVAAIESINTTITSTGDLIGELFKLFQGDALSFSEMSALREQIELENKRRDEALQLQKRLTEAQIEHIRAQTTALDRSDAIIKIDGAGLQPHLEAFMFEILRTIQTRVNQQGLDLLLGVPLL